MVDSVPVRHECPSCVSRRLANGLVHVRGDHEWKSSRLLVEDDG